MINIWFAVVILIVIFLLAVIAVVLNRKDKVTPMDYYALFILGFIWLILGLIVKNVPLIFLSLIFIMFGWSKNDKWKRKKFGPSQLNKHERKIWVMTIIILSVIIILGFILYILVSKG